MKTIISRLLLLGLVANLASCYTARIVSNVKADARPEFRRILIVSKLPNVRPDYLPIFQTAFPPGYQVCVVSNSPLSFDDPEQAIEKQRQTCQSEIQLTIDINRNYTSGTGRYISANNELYLEMKNLATGQPFWKALATTSGTSEVAPREVVNQLIKDGIIESSPTISKAY
ncbi:hypothetical protein [Spirosoma harenae]